MTDQYNDISRTSYAAVWTSSKYGTGGRTVTVGLGTASKSGTVRSATSFYEARRGLAAEQYAPGGVINRLDLRTRAEPSTRWAMPRALRLFAHQRATLPTDGGSPPTRLAISLNAISRERSSARQRCSRRGSYLAATT